MVELPLDDAATRYEELAVAINDIRWTMDTSDLKGAAAEALLASAEGFNEFTARTAEILQQQASAVRVQHAEDEQLRDAPKPAEVRELEDKAKELAVIAKYSVNPMAVSMAEVAAQAAAEKRQEREIALQKHTAAASTNAPRMRMEPPSLAGIAGVGGGAWGNYSGGAGEKFKHINPQGTPDKIGPGGGTPDKIGPGGGTPDKIGPGVGSPLSDTDVSTETSSDLMGGATPQQAMMGTPQAGAQQPTMPSMAGTGAQGGVPGSGMLSSSPGGLNAARNRKRDEKDRPNFDLSSGGVVGAVPMGGAGGVDRGVSINGVTTDKDTTGRVGMTNLSSGGGKPGEGGNPRGNMMGGRGGMMGGMGGMGSGANGGSNVKSKADNPIMSALKDRYLHGFDSLRDGVEGGMIGRDTSDAPNLDGTDQFLADDRKPKRDNGTGS